MTAGRPNLVDLHTHSFFSDGRLSPEELVEEAVWKGLLAIALTDHDTVDGLGRAVAAGSERGLEVVPGVELSCELNGLEVHIVGLFIRPDDELNARLSEIRAGRENRMLDMLQRLQEMGIHLTMDDIPQAAGKSFGRPHLAAALVKKGVVKSVSEAFARYIGDTGPANVPKLRFPLGEAVERIHACGGVSILAHPGVAGVLPHLEEIRAFGIMGVEAFYPKHAPETVEMVVKFCRQHGLLLSGGSDFHANGEGPNLGVPPVSAEVLEMIRARAQGR